ncbi:LOW QUALITY PROTEIN: RRP7 domain-containing protein, partial [Cephalotus follicularis]
MKIRKETEDLIKKEKKNKNTKLFDNQDEKVNGVELEKRKPTDKKKRKRKKGNDLDADKANHISAEDILCKATGEKKKSKSKKKKKISEVQSNAVIGKLVQSINNVEDGHDEQNGKSKKAKKKEKKDHNASKEGQMFSYKRDKAQQDEVYQISSGDDDSSKGLKKWITEYHQSRPGLKVLQQRIDEFITSHEAKLEQEREEKAALAAEGGWTVVTHNKGRKKTTESETGITVGSFAPAALNNMDKKKRQVVGLNFYRFQRREAQRNELLNLQRKFEQDKKRIQQLRAARNFRPY